MKINNFNTASAVNNNQPPAFKGNLSEFKAAAKQDAKKFLSLERSGTMNRKLFIANAFAFLLGTRIVTSRDKDEKREIFIRDIPSIMFAVAGVPTIQNAIAKTLQKSKKADGFVFTEKSNNRLEVSKWILNKLGKTPKEKVTPMSYGDLKSLYVYDENIHSGLAGFSQRLADNGGNVKGIFSNLSEDIKSGIAKLSNDNTNFIKELGKHENNGIADKIKEALKTDKNSALKKAEFLRTIPTVVGFGLTLSLLGIFIPKLNIHITETINKKRTAQTNEKADQEVA